MIDPQVRGGTGDRRGASLVGGRLAQAVERERVKIELDRPLDRPGLCVDSRVAEAPAIVAPVRTANADRRARTRSRYSIIALRVTERGNTGLLEIFRERAGFQSYDRTGTGLVSVSQWDSFKQADDATRVAASWVAENIDHLVKLQQSDKGEVVLSSRALAATR